MSTVIEHRSTGSGPGHTGGCDRVAALLAERPESVQGVIEVVERLQEILDRAWGTCDGVACFNRLYLRVVRDVREQLDDGPGADRDFLARLGVELGRRYFDALRADATGATPPRAWDVLLDRRARGGGPVEFAVLGVNAHVNFDLAPAIVRAATVLGRGEPGPAERADCRAVKDVFVRQLHALVEQAGAPGGVAADLPVVLAHEVTWRQALHLWEQRSRPTELERDVDALDRRTALIGRGLLTEGAPR